MKKTSITYDSALDLRVSQVFNTNRSYYEIMGEWHDRRGGIAVEPEVKRLIEAECRPGRRILEAGTGCGSISNWFGGQYPDVQFVAVDISQIGVSIGSSKAPPNVLFKVQDIKRLSFPDASFDFCFSQSVIEHVVGWQDALKELHRVLVTGGCLLIRISNGTIDSVSRRQALFKYLFRRNSVVNLNPSFELQDNNWKDQETNFDIQEIPSDVLLKALRQTGFSISHFTTGIKDWRHSPSLKARILSYLNVWPFNHLGSTTIVVAQKRS
jgi:ubiquinone/menaquinone biosynthesis C-methylase UbiE